MAASEHSLNIADLQALMSSDRPWSLAGWYAEPLSTDQANTLLLEARNYQQQAYARNQSGLSTQLLSWIASFWLKGDAQMLYQNLLAIQTSPRERALIELIHGQLLLSVKRVGAHSALERGFKLAAIFLSSEDYLVLMKRHELLAFVSTQSSSAVPQSLADLITEAQVIKRLQRHHLKDLKQAHTHSDTVD